MPGNTEIIEKLNNFLNDPRTKEVLAEANVIYAEIVDEGGVGFSDSPVVYDSDPYVEIRITKGGWDKVTRKYNDGSVIKIWYCEDSMDIEPEDVDKYIVSLQIEDFTVIRNQLICSAFRTANFVRSSIGRIRQFIQSNPETRENLTEDKHSPKTECASIIFKVKLRNLGERSGERALTESIIAAYDALLESDMTPDAPIPDSKVYVSADDSQVIGMTWGDDPQNIDPDVDEDDPESYLAQGYNCYTYADLYDVDEGFDLSQLPADPWELDSLEGKGLSLVANMEQHMYKKGELPSDEDALGEYVNPDEGWKVVSKTV